MSEYISSPCQVIKEGEQLDVKIPKSSVQIKSGGVVLFKEDGVYEVVVSNHQSSITVTQISERR